MSRLDELAKAWREAEAEGEAADEAVKNLELQLEEAKKDAHEKWRVSVEYKFELLAEAIGEAK